jgi:propanol-preferring alcohol dehydrogenase
MGYSIDGGFGEYAVAYGRYVVRVPDGIDPFDAAPLTCAGVTTYKAVKVGGVTPGDRVAIFGIGGLGHLAVQIARSFGAEVIAIDVSDEKLAFARSLGASHTINAATQKTAKEMANLGGAHVAVVTSAAKAAYDSAFYSLRPGGTIAVVGLPAEPLSFPAIAMVAREAHIFASAVGTRQDVRDILALAAEGKVKCQIETRPLERINETFEEMRQGKITGRVVVQV